MPSIRERLAAWLAPSLIGQGQSGQAGGYSFTEEGASKSFALGPAVVGDGLFRSYLNAMPADSRTSVGDYLKLSVGVYACTNLRATTLAGLPLKLFLKDKAGEKRPSKPGPIAELLERVNPFWTFEDLVLMTELSLQLWGKAFWVLERGPSRKGLPTEIWWAHPEKMRPVPDPVNYVKRFDFAYDGTTIPFSVGEVIWFRYMNPLDEFDGLSPLSSARISVETSMDALKSNRRIFQNGMLLGGVVSPEDSGNPLTKEQVDALEEHLARRFQGVDKAHKFAVLSGGVKVSGLGINPKDAEFLGLMRWSLADICRVYQVPPILVQDLEKSTYSNFEQALKALWSLAVIPESKMIARTIREQLLTRFPGEADDCEFDTSGVRELQEDWGAITVQMKDLSLMGVPLNRILQVLRPELLPVDGQGYAWGDVPSIMPGPVDQMGATPPPSSPAPPKDPAAQDDGSAAAAAGKALRLFLTMKAYKIPDYGSEEHKTVLDRQAKKLDPEEKRFKAWMAAIFKRQQEAVIADLPAVLGDYLKSAPALVTKFDDDPGLSPFDRHEWDDELEAGSTDLLSTSMKLGGEAAGEEIGLGAAYSFDIQNPEAKRFLRERAQRFASQVNETTWSALKASLEEGMAAGEGLADMEARVADVMGNRIGSSTETIARTETSGAYNGGTLQAYQESGIVSGKAWLSALDDRTRDAHVVLHGTVVGLDEDFESRAGGKGPAPGQMDNPEDDCNCRCAMQAVIGEGDEEAQG